MCVAAIGARHQRIGPDFNLGGYVRIFERLDGTRPAYTYLFDHRRTRQGT
jgi:hypothetical protein